jgi:hypothetical protein
MTGHHIWAYNVIVKDFSTTIIKCDVVHVKCDVVHVKCDVVHVRCEFSSLVTSMPFIGHCLVHNKTSLHF